MNKNDKLKLLRNKINKALGEDKPEVIESVQKLEIVTDKTKLVEKTQEMQEKLVEGLENIKEEIKKQEFPTSVQAEVDWDKMPEAPEFPDKVRAEIDWDKMPRQEIITEKTEFPKGLKDFSLEKLFKFLKQKAKDIVNVNITNKFLGVRFLRKNARGDYIEVEPDDIFKVTVAGGGGPSNVGIKDAGNTRINPATEETLQDVKTAVENIDISVDNIEIDAGEINLNTDAIEGKLDTLNSKDFATEATLGKLNGFSLPVFDEVACSYTGDNLTGVVYKLATVTVATLTLEYDLSNNLTSVIRT